MLSREWRCSWRSACPTTSEWSTILLLLRCVIYYMFGDVPLHYLVIIIVQVYLNVLNNEIFVRYILASMCLRSSVVSLLPFMKHMWLCVHQLTDFSFDDCDNICTWYYHHHHQTEIFIINHLIGFGHETMVYAVCLAMFFWCLLKKTHIVWWYWTLISMSFYTDIWFKIVTHTRSSTITPPMPESDQFYLA